MDGADFLYFTIPCNYDKRNAEMNVRKILICAVLFIVCEAALILFVDQPLSEYLRQVDAQYPAVINVFRDFTDLGKSKWYLWPSGLALVFCAIAHRVRFIQIRQKLLMQIENVLLFLFLSLAASGIVTDIIKPLLGRARPVELARENIYGFYPFSHGAKWESMPSGHATTAFALAWVCMTLWPRWRAGWMTLGFSLAASRVMVNAHFLSDVCAGAAVGIALTELTARALNYDRINPLRQWLFPIDSRVKSH
jgi:membrane-associated phospholipid phosphatase